MKNLEELFSHYRNEREEIQKRLREFKEVLNESDERIFAELAFCLCTPQSKATLCWNAINSLVNNGMLYRGNENQIRHFLNAVRFGESKSKYIVGARKKFTIDRRLQIKSFIQSFVEPFELREWLTEHVKGLGMKEASHFLRNIGFGQDLAILDRHILKNLKEHDVITEIPKTLSKKDYLEIEDKMREFAKQVEISLGELDLLFWSKETGIIFK